MYYISFITVLLLLKVSELGSHNMAATNQHLIFVFNRWLLVQIMHICKIKNYMNRLRRLQLYYILMFYVLDFLILFVYSALTLR